MEKNTRRDFIISGSLLAAGAALPGCGSLERIASTLPYRTTEPRRALVVWFSQTRHSERIGRVIASVLSRRGIETTAGDVREIDAASVTGYDLIVAGSPVFYYDTPGYMRRWLESIPRIEGTPVASYATFGGPGHNQHNTACTILSLLAGKGGVPAGLDVFGNMSAFAPTWSAVSVDRILRYRHLPNGDTYGRARNFAELVLKRVAARESFSVRREFTSANIIGSGASLWFTKLLVGKHTIDRNKCIQCGTCVSKCPVNAIDLASYTVNRDTCVFCVGCINNCPVQAFDVTFMGKPVYGFNEFLSRNNIEIVEPAL